MSHGGRKVGREGGVVGHDLMTEDLADDGGGEAAGGATGGAQGGPVPEGDEGKEPTLTDLANIFRAHMAQQEAQEARIESRAAQQEQRYRALQHQFTLLRMEVQAWTSPVPPTTD